METRVLTDRDEKKLEAFLRPHADSSMFLRANLHSHGVRNEGELFQGEYVGSFDGRSLRGVLAQFNTGGLIPQAPVPLLPQLVSTALRASGRSVSSVVGPADQVDTVLGALRRKRAKKRLDAREGLYALELRALRAPTALRAQRLQARAITEADRDPLLEWFDSYEVECLGARRSKRLRRESEERFERALQAAEGFLLLRDGTPVSYSGFNAKLPDAVQVGGVYTPVAERGRGFARAIVAHSLLEARKRGVERATLFTADDNTAAKCAYRALGFERVGDFRLTLLS